MLAPWFSSSWICRCVPSARRPARRKVSSGWRLLPSPRFVSSHRRLFSSRGFSPSRRLLRPRRFFLLDGFILLACCFLLYGFFLPEAFFPPEGSCPLYGIYLRDFTLPFLLDGFCHCLLDGFFRFVLYGFFLLGYFYRRGGFVFQNVIPPVACASERTTRG